MYELIIIFGIALILLILYMWKEAYRNAVVELELQYNNFPLKQEELTIFFISDIHRRLISEKIIKQVKGRAQLVIIGGDLTEKGVPFDRTKENIQRLSQIAPVYFIWGNNDYEVNVSHFRQLLNNYNVKILENSFDYISKERSSKICLIGLNDISYKLDELEKTIQNVDQDAFKILVCHNPGVYSKIKATDRISLLLSGHTHGGQINFFGLSLYPKGRLYRKEKCDLLISNGYGTTGIPFRFYARAETHLLRIKRK